jgi:hypothetical protein
MTVRLRCAGGVTYESDGIHHLDEGAEIDRRRLESVSFSFEDWPRRRNLDLTLTQGGGYNDELVVSGNDRDWVQSTFVTLTEYLNEAPPSTSWFTRHPMLTYNICALAIGTGVFFVTLAVVWFVATFLLSKETLAKLLSVQFEPGILSAYVYLISFPPGSWITLWWAGLPGASYLRDWILGGWPKVDLDVGPEHERVSASRRSKIRFVLVAIALPIALRFLYDVMTFFGKHPR